MRFVDFSFLVEFFVKIILKFGIVWDFFLVWFWVVNFKFFGFILVVFIIGIEFKLIVLGKLIVF